MAIQIRRGTDAEWESNKSNIVAGEPAVAMDTERMFIGTGSGTYMEVANIEVLADAFDSSASYVVGDFVSYHGKVYKCNTEHSGAWNASHFDEVALADALDALGDDVYTKDETDALLALKADESDVGSALALKADKSDTYTKSQVDSALALKANTADVNSALALKADKSDTYTKGQVDSALALKADAGDVYTKTEIDTELEDYAKVDGSYEGMTVGNAEELTTNLVETDKVPYIFRTSGGNAEIGNRENDTIVGGSVAWNQLTKELTSADWAFESGVTGSFANGVATFSSTTANNGLVTKDNIKTINGHKYLVSFSCKCNTPLTVRMILSQNILQLVSLTDADWKRFETIVSPTSDGAGKWYFFGYNTTYTDLSVKSPMFIDLTQMFGSTIADYLYTLESGTEGAGVAKLKSWGFFDKDYYPYDAGTLKHVSGLVSHDMTGFNQWDEEWEVGSINATTGQNASNNSVIRSKNYIHVVPSTTYFMTKAFGSIFCYDADKNYIGASITWSASSGGYLFTPNKNNTHYIRFVMTTAYGTTYKNDICINLHWDGTEDGTYEPYIKRSYPLDNDLVLRGIPKKDNDGNLYYDGDTYEHDGTVTRNVAEITLDGSESKWFEYTGHETEWCYLKDLFANRIPKYILQNNWGIANNMLCISNIGYGDNPKGSMSTSTANSGMNLYVIFPNGITSLADFKTWLSTHPVTIVYTLATPTTESAEPFASPQIVDNWGTEEYVGAEIPVGHDTAYPINLKSKVEASADNPQSDGIYILSYQNGTATYAPLASTDTITNIIARLEALEGGE